MKVRQTVGNNVMVKLDPENEFIKTKGGLKLFVDTSHEPEKHIVRIGRLLNRQRIWSRGKGKSRGKQNWKSRQVTGL